ncbi:uncharacterized protein BXZ73DRAFT_77656 [Epithele typhae]|uniref:uncharacterized protein n=1 Tax=Epithele typhae TaxID=378194 RepID=UPI002007316A|nr:uncharacterized protein BXZ73DRAFT_77656 [Epithele typhae]KAH9931632.1 hypothetical protein BXZ73DRAFT_77656 [Epithele typhae]
MASAQPAHDPALTNAPSATPATATAPGAPPAPAANIPASIIGTMNSEQIATLLKHIPDIFRGGDLKDSAAAEALSHLSQGAFLPQAGQLPPHVLGQQPIPAGALPSEPGPSSHPRGPPNLGQLSALASVLQATAHAAPQPMGNDPNDAGQQSDGDDSSPDGDKGSPTKSSGRRGGRSATMTNDEWARIRKDNHKEVERRRRGNINEGINELGRIVPNGSGEKAKGAILSRAVQYIHHLKENEARNIEKWTLEKLLMDQAMGDLQTQLEEMRRMWEEERNLRTRLEAELELLRSHKAGPGAAATSSTEPGPVAAATAPNSKDNSKREREENEEGGDDADAAAVEGELERKKRPRKD